jgi:hypothetical protein
LPHQKQAFPGTPPLLAYLAQRATEMVFPICWHDPTIPYPKYVKVASCFALKFRERLIGVTAAHVVDAYRETRKKIPTLTCQLRNLCDFDLEGALIDYDLRIDLATFALTEAQLATIQSPAFNCQNYWPPPEPRDGNWVSFAGFAECLLRPDEKFRVNTDNLAGGVSSIQVGEREIRMILDPRTVKAVEGIPMLPPGTSLSGCSGAPVIMAVLEFIDGKPRPIDFTVVGTIVDSTHPEKSQGEIAEYPSIIARRMECLQPDGKLVRPHPLLDAFRRLPDSGNDA